MDIIFDERKDFFKDKLKHKRILLYVFCSLIIISIGFIFFSYHNYSSNLKVTSNLQVTSSKGGSLGSSNKLSIKPIATSQLINILDANNIVNPEYIASKGTFGVIEANISMKQGNISNDNRYNTLYSFLESMNSPMVGDTYVFLEVADKYNLDWRLLPAIACTESGCGRIVPINYDGSISYNAFGFGVPGNGSFLNFSSWADAINRVGKAIAEDYGTSDPYIIERTYTPPSYNSDHHWANTVRDFMNQL